MNKKGQMPSFPSKVQFLCQSCCTQEHDLRNKSFRLIFSAFLLGCLFCVSILFKNSFLCIHTHMSTTNNIATPAINKTKNGCSCVDTEFWCIVIQPMSLGSMQMCSHACEHFIKLFGYKNFDAQSTTIQNIFKKAA